MTTVHSSNLANQEPIPGYRLKQLLGVGGYGEVWSAEAPGGLTKAIKLVHRHLDEQRAATEIEALNRIKQVRHPFLLSLERIELVDGRLVIVCELAEFSLKDRFQRSRDAGLPGIPREELLGHLKDAAEVLDYIREYHALQHLDVKPENLLLIGGRVKLADFGLVAEIDAENSTNVGGLTPIYASPEVFDGRPSPASDQYSLAVVFVEMLTGTLPYNGTTTAQLAAQHLEGRPNLAALSAADRPIVARALSKDPTQRFGSCRELVDRLSWISPAPQPAARETASGWPAREAPAPQEVPPPTPPAAADLPVNTISWDEARYDWKGAAAPVQDGQQAGPIVDLPQFEADEGQAVVRPVLFLGLGGTGARVLASLRRRLCQRYGGMERLPAVGMLLVDTSASSVCADLDHDPQASLSSRQILLTSLRPSGEYTRTTAGKLRSTARRWMFNVPRSLKTEGFRPLGRLALIDHLDKFVTKLRTILAEIMTAEAVGVTAAHVNQPAGSITPRIFVVGSMCGGTGSGMFVEAAYAVRNVLARMGLPNHEIYGTLCYSLLRSASSRDLAVANAYALLRELRHFSHPDHAYPGEPECGLPPAPRGQGPFDDTYVSYLGDDLSETEMQRAMDHVAEYLFRSALTTSSSWLDRCRQSRRESGAPREPRLSTFALLRLAPVQGAVIAQMSSWASRSLVQQWLGQRARGDSPRDRASKHSGGNPLADDTDVRMVVDPRAAEQCRRFELEFDNLVRRVQLRISQAMHDEPEAYLTVSLEHLIGSEASTFSDVPFSAKLPQILDSMDVLLGARSADQHAASSGLRSLYQEVSQECEAFVSGALTNIIEWAFSLADTTPARLRSAQRAIDWFLEHTRALERSVATCLSAPQEEMRRFEESSVMLAKTDWITSKPGKGTRRNTASTFVDPQLAHYFRLRLDELTLREVARVAEALRGPLGAVAENLRELYQDLHELSASFEAGPRGSRQPAGAGRDFSRQDPLLVVSEFLRGRPNEIVSQVELELERDFFGGPPALRRLITQPADRRAQLAAALRQAARTVVARACVQVNAQDVALTDHSPSPHRQSRQEWVDTLAPCTLACGGGGRRVLVIKPAESTELMLPDDLSKYVAMPPCIITDREEDTIVCCEGEQIRPASIVHSISGGRREFNELAMRLQSRADVSWSELS